ncbi:MAG: tRNA lysidine(34) synthetase TilS [Gemmatimonadota bacterium]
MTDSPRFARAGDLELGFRRLLERRPFLAPRGASLLIAYSGGPDSTALLYLLRAVAEERGLRLHAAHYDHGLRPDSRAEAELVARRARSAGVAACTIGRPAERLEPHQAAFRAARYAFLAREAARVGASRIATGHQADDQAETVLFRLLRGTGLRGLGGIPPRRGRIVRPLLPFWREEILAYLEGRGIPFLEDPSNRDRRWARSRIRHDLLPALEGAAGPELRRRLVELAASARRADRALDAAARRAVRDAVQEEGRIRVARLPLATYDRELRARIVRLLARRLGISLGRGGTRAAVEFIKRGRSGSGVDLAERLQLRREFDLLWLGPPSAPPRDEVLAIAAPRRGSGSVVIGGHGYLVAWGPEGGLPKRRFRGAGIRKSGRRGDETETGWTAELRLARDAFPLRLRGPRPGDRLRLHRGTRKLKRLFNEHRIPLSERPGTVVLEAAGRLVWVAGIGTAIDADVAAAGPPPGAVGSPSEAERFSIGIWRA